MVCIDRIDQYDMNFKTLLRAPLRLKGELNDEATPKGYALPLRPYDGLFQISNK